MAHHTSSVTPPPPPGGAGRLGEKIEATIERVVAWVINVAGEAISSILRSGIELLLEVLAEILAPYAQHMHDEIVANPAVPDYVKAALRRPSETTDSGDAIFSLVYIVTAVIGGWRGMIAPSSRLSEQYVDKSLYSARPDPQAAWAMIFRTEDETFYRDGMHEMGWHDIYVNAWREVMRPRMAAVDLLRAAHRGDMTFDAARRELQLQGWTADDVNRVEALSYLLPGPADLISMAVRGAFSPEEIEQFQLALEFPPEFETWMQRQGFSTEWARRFWYAHWVLPSLSAGYEMFHRGIITSEQLDLLLKTQDISPFWRDKLRELSYNPLTRVDVRRMYGMGVLDRDDVVRSYLDLGYSPENAELMTQFTLLYEADEERAATKADILAGYREGMLSETEAVDWLATIGYGTELASFLVARETAKLQRDLLDKEVNIVRDHYIAREISEPQARSQLTVLGLASTEIDLKLEDWSIDRRAKLKRPTQEQTSRFLRDEIISVDQFTQALSDLGYQDAYIDWYLESVLTLKEEDTAKLEQEARDEQEKIRVREVKSDYQVAKATLDVHIAELRTAITDLQIAMQTRTARYKSERRIAEELLTEAELRDQAESDIAELQAAIDAQREAIAYLRTQIETRETLIADLGLQETTQRAEIQPEVEAAESVLDTLESTLHRQQAQVDALQTDIAAARAVITETTADVEQLRLDIAELQAGIRERNTYIDRLQTQIAEAREIITGTGADVEQLRQDIAELQAGIRERNTRIDRLQTQIAEAREIIGRTTPEAETLRRDVAELQAGIRDRNTLIDQRQTRIAEIRLQIAQRKEALAAALPLAASDEEAAALEAAAEADLLAYDVEIRELQVQIEGYQDANAEAQEAITAANEQIRLLGVTSTETIAEQRDLIAALQVEVEGYQDTNAEALEAIAATNERIRLLEAASTETVAEQQATIAALQVEVETHQDVIAEARGAIAAAQEQIRLAEVETAGSVQEQQELIAGYQLDIEEVQDAIQATRQEIRDQQAAIVDIKRPLTRVSTVIDESRVVIERAEDDIAQAQSTIVTLEAQINARRVQLRQDIDVVSKIRTLDQIVSEYETDIAQMRDQLRALQQELGTTREEKAELQREYQIDLIPEV